MATVKNKTNTGISHVHMEKMSVWYTSASPLGNAPYKALTLLKDISDVYNM